VSVRLIARIGLVGCFLGFALATLGALPVRAETHGAAGESFRGLLPIIERHLKTHGATGVSAVARAFLFEGEATVHEVRLSRRECVGFLALGTGEVRDVDLAIHTRAGQPLAEDLAQQPMAYARVCGGPGLVMYVSATMYAGRGELLLLRVEHAPRGVERLPEAINFAVSAGGRAEQTRGVGGAPDELMLDLKLEQAEGEFRELGYRASARATALELRAGVADGALILEAQRCYRVVAYVPVSRGVLMDVHAPSPSEKRWEARAAQDERAELALCTDLAGVYSVRVQARPMRGVVILRAFEHEGAATPAIRALGPARALTWAEANVVAKARGFELAPLGEAWVESSLPHAWPVSLKAGVCYAFAGIADGGAQAVDVRLIDANGVLVARNEGRRKVPLLFTCAKRDETARLVLRARGQDGAVSIWWAQNSVAARAPQQAAP
jgi:hypothetical protein